MKKLIFLIIFTFIGINASAQNDRCAFGVMGNKCTNVREKGRRYCLYHLSKDELIEIILELRGQKKSTALMSTTTRSTTSNNLSSKSSSTKSKSTSSSSKKTSVKKSSSKKTSYKSYSSSGGQCRATTKKGTRCSRTARSNGYCWQHGG